MNFSQNFDFESSSSIFAFGIVVLVIIIFIFIGIAFHRNSESPALRFITRKSAYPFYMSAIVSSFSILIAVWFMDHPHFDTVELAMIAVVVICTLAVVGTISIVGCQFYRSFICWNCLRFIGMDAKTFAAAGYLLVIVVLLFDCFLGYIYLNETEYYTFIDISHIVLILFATVASLASKIAQIQWYACTFTPFYCIFMCLFCVLGFFWLHFLFAIITPVFYGCFGKRWLVFCCQ